MRVLMLGSDHNVFIENSEARDRMVSYATQFTLHYIAVTQKKVEGVVHGALSLSSVHGIVIFSRLLRLYVFGKKVVRENKPDIISVQGPDEIGFIGFLLSRRFTVPLQVQIHTDIFSPWYRKASWKEWARFHIAKWLILRADCLRVVSQRIKRSLIGYYHIPDTRITVLPIFTGIERFIHAGHDTRLESRLKEYTFKVVAVGRFVDKEKNFSLLIRVIHQLARQYPHAVLILVGSGRDQRKYEKEIKKYRLEKNVIIEPYSNNLPALYKASDVFILSSKYEGWGRAVVEAMATGCAVIMTDVGLAGELVKNNENGIVVPVDDEDGIFNAITMLYTNTRKRHELATRGQQTVFYMRQNKEEYLRAYKDTLASCVRT